MKCRVKVYTLHYLQHSQTGAGFDQASYLMGTKGSFLGAKRPKRDVDHLPPSGPEVKNELLYVLSPCMPLSCGQGQLYLVRY